MHAYAHRPRRPRGAVPRPLSLLVLLVAAAPSLRAQPPATPPVFHACYVPLTGTVYRVQTPDTRPACASSAHVLFAWTDGLGALRVGGAAPAAGQVLGFNGAFWAPTTPAAGVTDHGLLAGLADDDHPQYLLANGARTALNGFAVTGTEGSGSIPATGSGTRLMWYPHKAAFRAGTANGDYWNDDNVGRFSFAGGINTRARGERSVAFGSGSSADGNYSFAHGNACEATADYAVALGRLCHATGIGSVALGQFSEASAQGAVAMAYEAHATAFGALALGTNLTASGDNSVALGANVSTDGHAGSFFFGDHTHPGPDAGTNSTNNQFAVRAQHVWFGTTFSASNTAGHYIDVGNGAYLSTGGTWTNASSRDVKENFTAVDPAGVLARIAALPVTEWNYKAESASTRHLGPMAQDFYRVFRLGDDDEHIASLDVGGVSLLGIQALERRTRELERENAALRARLDRLEAAVRRSERRAPRR